MKVKNIEVKGLWQWKVMEYMAYLIVFLTPLYFINNHLLFSFNSPKTILMIGIVLLMTILYSWGILIEKKLSFRLTPLHIISLIFLFILTASSILGIDPLNSFFGKWTAGVNLILIYALVIFAFLTGFLIKKSKSFPPKILIVSFISSICVAIISYTGDSLTEVFKDGNSTIGNSSYAGAYLLFNVCFGIGLFLYYSKIWKKISIALGTFIILFSPILFNKDILLGKIEISEIIHKPFLLFGYANAADIGLVVSILAIISFFLIFSSKKITKVIGVILLFSLISGIFYIGLELVRPTSPLHRIYVEQKGENRFIAWDAAKRGFADHPLLGSGFNNFYYNYQKYFTSEILELKNPEFYFSQPHNIVFEYASNNGLLGLLSYFGLLIFTFLALFGIKEDEDKGIKMIRVTLISVLFGYFVQNLFGFDTPTTYLMLFLVVGIAIGLSKKEWIFNISDKRNGIIKFILSLIIVISFVSIFLFVILPRVEFRRWGEIVSTDSMEKRISLREGVQDISFFGGVADSTYVAENFFYLYKENINQINDSNRNLSQDEIQSTIDQVEKDIIRQPYEIRSYIMINQLLNMEIFIKGKIDEDMWNQSYDNIQKALILNPQNPEIYLLLAQTYTINKDFKNAYLSVRQAIVIDPTYTKSYEYARKLLKIKPDVDFQKYVDDIEKQWLLQVVTQ